MSTGPIAKHGDTDVGSDSDEESLIDLASEPEEWGACESDAVGSWGAYEDAVGLAMGPVDILSTTNDIEDVRTTVLITSVTKRCSAAELSRILNREGLQGCYDFIC